MRLSDLLLLFNYGILYFFDGFFYSPHALFDIFVGSAVGYSDMSGAAEYLARYGRDSCFFKQP